jgi:hypothetical protein
MGVVSGFQRRLLINIVAVKISSNNKRERRNIPCLQ